MVESTREQTRPSDGRPSDEGRAQRLYEAWLEASAPGVPHPWDILDDDHKAIWRKVVEAIRG
jgi:hypothetical protein